MELQQYQNEVIDAIRNITNDKKAKHIVPSYAMMIEVSEYLSKRGVKGELRNALNALFVQSKISVYKTLNSKAVELK